MKLWILVPVHDDAVWDPWYDKVFGFVVRAETEEQARLFASQSASDETPTAWLDASHSLCEELRADSDIAGVIMIDMRSA